jgi:glycosyltransferase involved in cell wall biosynthesis
LRLLFLADAVFEDKPGGSRVVARELAHGLAQRGHEVTFLVASNTLDRPSDEFCNGVRIVRYSGAGRATEFVREGRAACARLWAERPFDIVHTHFAYAALGPLQAVPHDVPQVRSFYGPWAAEGWLEDQSHLDTEQRALQRVVLVARNQVKRMLRHRVEAKNLQLSKAVIVLSEQSRREVISFGYTRKRIHKIAGGVDVERFRPTADKHFARQTLGLPPDRRILLSVRRLTPRMGLDNLIQAMTHVTARYPGTLLLIGGAGPDRERLEDLISTTGAGGHVRLIGFIPDDQLTLYYQAVDLFVLPTIALEGFGLVTVEALACGTPVVGTPIGATPEILEEIDNRLIMRGTSPDELSEGILNLRLGAGAHSQLPQ